MAESVKKRTTVCKASTKTETKYTVDATNRSHKTRKNKHNLTNLLKTHYIHSFLFGLFIGYIIMLIFVYYPNVYVESSDNDSNRMLTAHRIKLKKEFLSHIDGIQSNCNNPKILVMELFGNSLAEMHHFVGQALLIAVATNRRFHIVPAKKNRMKQQWIEWSTIYEPLSKCAVSATQSKSTENVILSVWKYYGMSTDDIVYFDNITWHKMSTISRFRWQNGVFNSMWFGKYGNVFIRSFIQYYIWNKMNDKTLDTIYQNNILQMMQKHNKFIKFIVVDIDEEQRKNKEMKKHRNFMEKINGNQLNNGTKVIHIFIAKLSNDDIRNFMHMGKGEFYISLLNDNLLDEIIRAEMLRLSTYMSGSARNSLFRLGMELQYATNWVGYDYSCPQNAYSIDIPWLQDP